MAAPKIEHFDYKFDVIRNAARNWRRRRAERERNKIMAATGRLDEVETTERIAANQRFQREALRRRSAHGPGNERLATAALDNFFQERVIGDRDFLGIEFLEMAMAVSRFVGRVHIREQPGVTSGFGSGFVVSPRLFLTNNHVLSDPAIARNSEVEFDYQKDRYGRPLTVVVCALEPDIFFLTDPKLDFTLVAVREKSFGSPPLKNYAWVRLRAESGKALIGQPLNIIQHPRGEMKQLVLRSNKLVDIFDDLVHYETDTEPGSSGSPVFSDLWDLVALHHSAVPKTNDSGQYLDVDGNVWIEGRDDPQRLAWVGNEGIRISSIVKAVKEAKLDSQEGEDLVRDMLEKEPPHPLNNVVPITSNEEKARTAVGSVTVTIPLHVTVSLGEPTLPATAVSQPATTVDVSPATSEMPVIRPPSSRSKDPASTEASLAAAQRELGSNPDILSVNLGYVFKDGWITDERALVVTLHPKRSAAKLEAARSSLPQEFQGLPVEVTPPSIEDLIRLSRGPAVAEAAFTEAALGQEITYTRPSGAPLKKVTATMRVVAHVSPDAGWPQLKKFLKSTGEGLVIGMYDFGAPHIVDTLAALRTKSSFKKLTLVLQKGESVGEGTKVDDLHDGEVVDKLGDAFGSRFEHAWVKIGKTNGWVSSSYHIKVAVRDQEAFWLSSGNWQSSNQPQAEPLDDSPADRSWLDRYNREWHAIVEHKGLAEVFEKHLLHDYANNLGTDGVEELALPDLLIPAGFLLPEAAEAAIPFEYFQPFDAKRKFTVLPLLTPDNYHEHVLELIESTQDELLIQNQTFNAPKPDHKKLRELLEAVLAKQKTKKVKVRVIFRLLDTKKARTTLEGLKDMGFNMSDFRVQKNCHTKGIIVDRQRVLLGSQNLSNDGVSVNRDASLLFDDDELAQYFAKIFDHDWRVLAKKNIGSSFLPIEWVPAREATPEDRIRLSWKDYMEML